MHRQWFISAGSRRQNCSIGIRPSSPVANSYVDHSHKMRCIRSSVRSSIVAWIIATASWPTHQVACSDMQLKSVLRAAARLVLRLPARSQVSDLMHEKLHWLDINKRVTFKLCVIGYKCQHELSPGYLSSMCVSSCSIPGRASLQSSTLSTLLVPRVSTKSFGMRGFFYACPSIWNNLPPHLRRPELSLYVNSKDS